MITSVDVIKAIRGSLDCSLSMAKKIYDTRPSDNIIEILEYGKSILPKNVLWYSPLKDKFYLHPEKFEKEELNIKASVRLAKYFIISTNPEVIAFFEKNRNFCGVAEF